MKKIGIDARLITQTGVGVYTKNLLLNLEKLAPREWQVNVYLRAEDFNAVEFSSKNFYKKRANFAWHSFDEQLGFLKLLNKDDNDLVHFTYFSYPIRYKRKFISTIHDLTPLLYKTGKASTKNPLIYNAKYFVLSQVLKTQLKNSQAIITPTKSVKNELLKVYGQAYEGKIFSIYEGVSEEIKNAEENNKLKDKFKDFLICVNNFYPHKNTDRLIQAFKKIKTSTKLILIGPDDFFANRTFQLINQLKLNKEIICITNVKLRDLVFFYKNAKAIINPSLSEGFGLSLVEAAYFSCPIIASDIPVFREVLEENYLKFNPRSVDDIESKIKYFIANKPKFDYKKISAKYSFEKMTKETLKLYEKFI